MKRNRTARSFFLMVFSLSIAILVLVTQTVPIWAYSLNFQATNQPERQTDDVLRIWTDETVGPVLEDLANDFYAAYQVELVVEVVDNVFNDFFQAVPLGNGPDISYFPHDRLGMAVQESMISPIDLGAKQAQFLDSALQAATVDGQLYGLPWATENLAFFYNTTLVPIPPATWGEVQTMGEALITSGDVVYGMSLAGKTYDAYPLMTAYGGYIFGQDLDGNWDPDDLGIDSPGMIAAVDWLAERVNDGFLSGDTDWENAHILFETGHTPFLMTGPWSLDRIRASGIPYAITDFPSHTLPGVPFLGVQVFVINAHSANIPMAETFLLDFVATEDTMTALAEATKRPPAHIPAMANITDPDMLTFAAISEYAVPMPNIPEMSYVWGPWDNAVSSAMQGDQTAEDALTSATQEILDSYLLEGMVNVPGTYQTQIGCAYDWQTSCSESAMTEIEPGLWKSGPFELLAGNYEVKVALDGGWAINYGLDGIIDGHNIPFSLRRDGEVTFYWDEETKVLSIEKENFLFLPAIGK